MYFSSVSAWGDLADFWDAAQGYYGDIYRWAIINPDLLKKIKECQPQATSIGLKVLDLGCGNGCISRYLAENGLSVIGIDKFDSMLQLAHSYATPVGGCLEYKQHDLNELADVEGEQIAGPYDFVIACFSLQDCSNLEVVIQLAAKNIVQNGFLLIIYEDLTTLEQGTSHLSTRMWLGDKEALKDGGHERKQLVFWAVDFIKMAQDEQAYICFQSLNSVDTFCTQTTIRDERAYLEAAAQYGFRKSAPTTTLRCDAQTLRNLNNNMVIRRYELKPKFQLICLQYTGDINQQSVGVI